MDTHTTTTGKKNQTFSLISSISFETSQICLVPVNRDSTIRARILVYVKHKCVQDVKRWKKKQHCLTLEHAPIQLTGHSREWKAKECEENICIYRMRDMSEKVDSFPRYTFSKCSYARIDIYIYIHNTVCLDASVQ